MNVLFSDLISLPNFRRCCLCHLIVDSNFKLGKLSRNFPLFMIKSILVFNTKGQPRYIQHYSSDRPQLDEIYSLIHSKSTDHCNFIPYKNDTLVYRPFATYISLIRQPVLLLACFRDRIIVGGARLHTSFGRVARSNFWKRL